MKIISFSDQYRIYPDDLKTYDALPPKTFVVEFNKMSGYSLKEVEDFVQLETKIYGTHEEKVAKILSSFKHFQRSMGVILSGDKGIGKSMSTQILAINAQELGMPVIMVRENTPGIHTYLDEIKQECLVIFDEFEKVFPEKKNDHLVSQEELLGLFDGTSQTKRLYAITVNNVFKLSEFIVSRPGRFHYHIRFGYPVASEVEEYLQDKLDKEYWAEIPKVVDFASKVKLNYDSLRAIAFEISLGTPFAEAIRDLNILATDDNRYNVKVTFSNGFVSQKTNESLNLFDSEILIRSWAQNEYYSLRFDPRKAVRIEGDRTILDSNAVIEIDFDEEDNKVLTEGVTVESIEITINKGKDMHYNLAY